MCWGHMLFSMPIGSFLYGALLVYEEKCHLISMEGKEGCPLAHAFRYGDQKHMGATNLELPFERNKGVDPFGDQDESFLAHNTTTRLPWPKFRIK